MLVSIDPGVNGTGYALWDEDRDLMYARTIHPLTKEKKWALRARSISLAFHHALHCTGIDGIDTVIIESPTLFGGAKGHAVAASGDLVKLAMITGMLLEVCFNEKLKPILTTPYEWKGQLPKSVCERRIRNRLGDAFPKERLSSHAIDAIGIGLWYQGGL